MIKTLIFR